jgi:hypothetical protein
MRRLRSFAVYAAQDDDEVDDFFCVPDPGADPIFASSGRPRHVPHEKQRMHVNV